MASRAIIDFYDPAAQAADFRRRSLAQILAWPDDRLESTHDFIQVLFPLPEGSMFNMTAPVVDERTYLEFRSRPVLRSRLRVAFARMLRFYGLRASFAAGDGDMDGDGDGEEKGVAVVTVDEVDDPVARGDGFHRWVCRIDHNHLRITRILRSLRTLGLEDEARAFFKALVRTRQRYGRIGDTSLVFWRRAVRLPLWCAPDGDRVPWLRKYDEGRRREGVPKRVATLEGGLDEGEEDDEGGAEIEEEDEDEDEDEEHDGHGHLDR